MSKPLKYEKPKLINLSSAEWEIGAGVCYEGSSPDPGDYLNCMDGTRAGTTCNKGNEFHYTGSSY